MEKTNCCGVTSKLLLVSKGDNGNFMNKGLFSLNTDVAALNLLSINGNKYLFIFPLMEIGIYFYFNGNKYTLLALRDQSVV